MKKSQIIFSKYSPLMVVDTDLIGSDQKNIGTPRGCSLCRCGESRNKPLCDGSHAQVGFDGEREDADKRELEIRSSPTSLHNLKLCNRIYNCFNNSGN